MLRSEVDANRAMAQRVERIERRERAALAYRRADTVASVWGAVWTLAAFVAACAVAGSFLGG
jgi:hypothetical protein